VRQQGFPVQHVGRIVYGKHGAWFQLFRATNGAPEDRLSKISAG
jgi:hypothetical protein